MIPAASHHRLVAECIAFPLWHPRAIDRASVDLTRAAAGVASDPLAAPLVEHLRLHAHGASLPQLEHLRDLAWFPEHSCRVTLAEHVARVACDHLELRGLRVGLREDNRTPLPELTERWRWLSLALPSDLLVAALAATHRVEPPAEHVELVTVHLARVLRSPCAETHLHVGAAVPFGLLWTGLMRALADGLHRRTTVKKLKDSFGDAVPLRDADRFLHLLRGAALARVTLAAFLHQRENGSAERFDAFVTAWLPKLAARIPWAWGAADAHHDLRAMLRFLCVPSGSLPMEHVRARDLLRAVLGPPPRPRGTPYEHAVVTDPLAAWLDPRGHEALPETRFAARALAHLLADGARDEGFARTFWQYQRARGATFRALTQEHGTAGLHWFTRFYYRIGFFRETLPKHRGQEPSWFHALRMESRDLYLGALEARTSPGDSVVAVRDFVRDVTRQSLAHRPDAATPARPEVGLVLHFIKEDSYRGRSHADPRNRAFGARHAVWFERQRRRAHAIAGALEKYPELLLVLRGIDAANVEQAQPTWVLRPLFDLVREASVRASRRLARVVPAWRVTPLRATLHAGEDYLRITEGVRRMHEAVEFGVLRQGDRFGHGLAVGEDPERERGTTVAQAREDRLDDLLWEFDRYACGDIPGAPGRVEFVRCEAHRLACRIYPGHASLTLEALGAARRLRHDPDALARLRYPEVDRSRVAALPALGRELFLAHLTDGEVFARGRVPEAVESSDEERAMLVSVQRWLRRELARREITVESNPSSNLLIGDLHEVTRHPALRLQPVDPAAGRADAVQLSVNTDNPVTFASCLADEFALLYAALLDRGVAATDALAWIDRRREDGWRSRFTLEASALAENLARILPENASP